MRPRFYRPRHRLRSELLALVVVGLVSLLLALAVPMEAIDFVPAADPKPLSASCAFITLTEAEEARVLSSARAAWRVNARDVKDLRIEMFADSPPERAASEVLSFEARRPFKAKDRSSVHAPSLVPATLAAPVPQVLSDDGEEMAQPAFSREDLLRLN